MAYLTAHRYGLRKMRKDELPDYLREAGWEPGWVHESGYRAMCMPGIGETVWVTMNADWEVQGTAINVDLEGAARRIARLARGGRSATPEEVRALGLHHEVVVSEPVSFAVKDGRIYVPGDPEYVELRSACRPTAPESSEASGSRTEPAAPSDQSHGDNAP